MANDDRRPSRLEIAVAFALEMLFVSGLVGLAWVCFGCVHLREWMTVGGASSGGAGLGFLFGGPLLALALAFAAGVIGHAFAQNIAYAAALAERAPKGTIEQVREWIASAAWTAVLIALLLGWGLPFLAKIVGSRRGRMHGKTFFGSLVRGRLRAAKNALAKADGWKRTEEV